MSAAHPWLEQEPWPTEPLPKADLEKRIERLFTMTNIGYLGTTMKSGQPSVSPVEHYNDGMSLYFFPQPNSPKLKSLQRDPRAALAMANPMAGWACVMGAQVFGKVTLCEVDSPEWERGMQVFKYPASNFELGRDPSEKPRGMLARLDADRIVYTEHFLRSEGFAPRQIWRRDEDETKVVQGKNV